MMRKEQYDRKKPLYSALFVSAILLTLLMLFFLMIQRNIKQSEILHATEKYMVFESKIQRLIYSNVTLLHGFEAYIDTNSNLDEKDSYHYLDHLLAQNAEYIRNVAVLEDTTIIWNYPKDGNAATIGTDLSKVQLQQDAVLKVKTELRPVFQGPVNLLQGGTGFSVRIPIVREDTGYWGQISIILKSDELLNEIKSYAESTEIDIAIFSRQDAHAPFFGTVKESTIEFNMDPNLINWKIIVNLPDDNPNNYLLHSAYLLFAISFTTVIGILVFKYIKSNGKILDMSIRDSLTGLHNRHFLHEYQAIVLAAAIREKHKVGFIVLDLDQFKNVNDLYGHKTGDAVLAETAHILKECTRENEVAVRLGGDEFLLVLPGIEGVATLVQVKERLLKRFEQELKVLDHSIKVQLSIGYSLFPDDGYDIDALLHKADMLMYEDKLKNRNGSKDLRLI